MIHNKKEFSTGLLLIVAFFMTLFAIVSPLLEGGRNTLDYLDGMFNSISKDSAYYIPGVGEKVKKHEGTMVTLNLKAADAGQAARMEKLFASSGATMVMDGAKLSVSGDLGKIFAAILADADLMFKNEGAAVSAKYGFEEKRVLYDWHQALTSMTKDLNKQERFKEAKASRDVQTKAVEPAYNYYGVKAIPMSSKIGRAHV